MKIEIKTGNRTGKRGSKKNRGISCWNFCELWQKSEMTQSVCPTSAINPLWNQLKPPPVAPPFGPFPHCQRVKSIRAGCAPVQFDSCQSANLAAFSPQFPVVSPCSLSTSSYGSVSATLFRHCCVCGMHQVRVQHFVGNTTTTEWSTEEHPCEQDVWTLPGLGRQGQQCKCKCKVLKLK